MLDDLSLHILDIAQNGIAAGAGRIEITLAENAAEKTLTLTVGDNGGGAAVPERLYDPFYTTRTERIVGLGIPFLAQAAELTGGRVTIRSAPGKGMTVTALFHTDQIDMPPEGEISESVTLLAALNPAVEVRYTRQT